MVCRSSRHHGIRQRIKTSWQRFRNTLTHMRSNGVANSSAEWPPTRQSERQPRLCSAGYANCSSSRIAEHEVWTRRLRSASPNHRSNGVNGSLRVSTCATGAYRSGLLMVGDPRIVPRRPALRGRSRSFDSSWRWSSWGRDSGSRPAQGLFSCGSSN